MNKKAQGTAILYAFMIGILVFFLALGIAPALNQTINEARGTHYGGYYYDVVEENWYINSSEEISCESATISGQDKAQCVSLEAISPLFLGILLGLGGTVISYIAIK